MLYYLVILFCYIILECFLPITWAGQQYQYLKHGGDNPVANKKMTVGHVFTNITGQVVASCRKSCVCACVCECECACECACACACE